MFQLRAAGATPPEPARPVQRREGGLTTTELYVREGDVLVLGSDGMWDAMSNDEAAELVRGEISAASLPDSAATASAAATALVARAKTKSADDITAFVVQLAPFATPSEQGCMPGVDSDGGAGAGPSAQAASVATPVRAAAAAAFMPLDTPFMCTTPVQVQSAAGVLGS